MELIVSISCKDGIELSMASPLLIILGKIQIKLDRIVIQLMESTVSQIMVQIVIIIMVICVQQVTT